MLAKNAYEALEPTLSDIANILKDAGLDAVTKCSFSDVDFFDHETEKQNSALIYGEITFSVGANAAALECAVSVIEGEVADDELLSEISSLRAEARRIAKLANQVGKEGLFEALENEEQDTEESSDAEGILKDAWDRASDELEKDVDVLSFSKEKNGVGHLPYILGAAAVVALIILLIVLL